jgi:hypothetical protein
MDREHDQEVVCEHGEHTPAERPESSEGTMATDAVVGIRQPQLLEVTTSNGRVWFLVNLN